MTDCTDDDCDLARLSPFASELARVIATVASDIALVIDADGVVRSVAVGPGGGVESAVQRWVGRPWADTVTRETRPKIEQLLREAAGGGPARRREVNHPGDDGTEIPVAYAAIRLGDAGPVLAVGRELRVVAALQQRFLDAQAELEREYWKKRRAEARYRTLFQVATDAVLIVDAATLTVVDANQAAVELFDIDAARLVGNQATAGIDRGSRAAVEELLATARASGKPGEIKARLLGRQAVVRVSATPFRAEGSMLLLVRASRVEAFEAGAARLARMVELMPDALIVCDAGGRVLMANRAFVDLLRLGEEGEVIGRPLGTWLDPAGDDLRALLAAVQRNGIVSQQAVRVFPAAGMATDVSVSAVLLPEGEQTAIGMVLRPASGGGTPPLERELAVALEGLARQLGHDDLPTLLRASAEIAERHLLTAALRRAGGDRARAAAMLGLPPSDLELRLQRHRIAAATPDGGDGSDNGSG